MEHGYCWRVRRVIPTITKRLATPTPWGYKRIIGDDAAYSEFLRSLPLKGKGADNLILSVFHYKATDLKHF